MVYDVPDEILRMAKSQRGTKLFRESEESQYPLRTALLPENFPLRRSRIHLDSPRPALVFSSGYLFYAQASHRFGDDDRRRHGAARSFELQAPPRRSSGFQCQIDSSKTGWRLTQYVAARAV